MGWKHQRSHPRHPPQTIYARRQPSASVPSLQLGCEVACQLPSHRTSSAQQCYELWRRHAVDGFIWDARWQTARVCEFRTTQTQRERLPEKVLADAAQTDKAFSHSTEWQTWEWGARVCQVYCTEQTEGAVTYIYQARSNPASLNWCRRADFKGTRAQTV